MSKVLASVHPKSIEVHATYAPECWKTERRYYVIRRGQFGYWADMYTKLRGSDGERYCHIIFNDKIAKSFSNLCKKIDADLARHLEMEKLRPGN